MNNNFNLIISYFSKDFFYLNKTINKINFNNIKKNFNKKINNSIYFIFYLYKINFLKKIKKCQ